MIGFFFYLNDKKKFIGGEKDPRKYVWYEKARGKKINLKYITFSVVQNCA